MVKSLHSNISRQNISRSTSDDSFRTGIPVTPCDYMTLSENDHHHSDTELLSDQEFCISSQSMSATQLLNDSNEKISESGGQAKKTIISKLKSTLKDVER